MMKRIRRILLGVVVGVGVVVATLVILVHTLGDGRRLFEGKSLQEWCEQLTNRDTAVSNHASIVVQERILPQLTNQMFSDTNDSRLRLALIEQLNSLPGVAILFTPAIGRRARAANELGSLGPSGKPAVPALLKALKNDELMCVSAASALGKIQADPEVVIPALITCATNSRGQGQPEVVEALGEFGPRAKAAVPLLTNLLKDRSSKEIIRVVPAALLKIDPQAAAEAGRGESLPGSNRNHHSNER